MKRRIAIILIFISMASLLTGCWSKRELNELSIATAIGIDKSGDKYTVSVQLMNPSEIAGQKSSGQRAASVVYKAEGKSIFEALRRMTLSTSRRIYVSHVRVIIFGEQVSREGIKDLLDFLSRDHEMRSNVYMLTAKNSRAEDVLSILSVVEKIAANKIYLSLRSSEQSWAATSVVKLDELIDSISSKGRDAVMNGVLVKGNLEIGSTNENIKNSQPPAILAIDNIGVFKKDKLIGWLSEKEGIGYNQIMGKIKSTVVTVNSPEGGNVGIEIKNSKSSVKGKVENGKPKIYIDFKASGNVGDVQSTVDVTKAENIRKLEAETEKNMEKNMKEVIERAQKEFQSDIFGFGEAIRRSNPKEWKKIEKNWNNGFKDLPVDINTTVTIKQIGTTTKPIPGEIKE
ncbi:Ger(x)C family spore germination protein [Clostridium sp. A1-XYC3]|uniref:Ger(X)C family spore germination protein n=1 Tax=Clostridium tanneri TaxID=3037988 RepID=A0ABU4JWK5_9CLOT|nr:Ger(x)C family spore germination protein [Clostridium sp. A1-XYC3]MDW8802541.1 Ger(x)C family spore germination protein [Clostridium sp. A1-XYC3]